MRYTQMIDDMSKLSDYQKRLDSFGDGHTYIIVCGNKVTTYHTSEYEVPIVIDTENCGVNEQLLMKAIKKGKLLGDAIDYDNTSVINVNDVKNMRDLGNILNGNIVNGKLSLSEFNNITDLTILDKFNITDISGIDLTTNANKNLFAMPNLKKVRLPKSVGEIGNSAFAFCLALNDIVIHNRITAIRARAFYNCSSLTTLNIPSSVGIIEKFAFGACKNLKKLTFNSVVPPTIDVDTFKSINDTFIIAVPSKAVETYKMTWKSFANRIVAK